MKTENQNRSQEPPKTGKLVGVDLRRLVRLVRVALGWCMLLSPTVATLAQFFSQGIIAGIVTITLLIGLLVLLLAWVAAGLWLIHHQPNAEPIHGGKDA